VYEEREIEDGVEGGLSSGDGATASTVGKGMVDVETDLVVASAIGARTATGRRRG
jgi:hypothetical protein